jgi:hypothetical protein
VNGVPQRPALPESIGGLVDFALESYARRAPLYLALALLVFLVGCAVEVAIPGAVLGTPRGDLKLVVFEFSSIAIDAYVIAAVALGLGSELAKERASSSRIAGAATERWLAVLTVNVLVQLVVDTTLPFSGLGNTEGLAPVLLLTAPIVWVIWAILSLAGPIAALSGQSPAIAVFSGLSRAIGLSLRSGNLARLAVVTLATIVPYLLQQIAQDVLTQHHVPRPIFWASIPIDALTVGPVAAIQTAFALDFARRAGMLEKPPD